MDPAIVAALIIVLLLEAGLIVALAGMLIRQNIRLFDEASDVQHLRVTGRWREEMRK